MSDGNLNNPNDQERLQKTPPTSRVHVTNRGKTFTASCRMVYVYPQDSVDLKLISQAAIDCGFKMRETTQHFCRFKSKINWRSWSEEITAHLELTDNKVLIDTRSVCSLPTTIVDWGKNKTNTTNLFERINTLLPTEAQGSVLQLCPSCGLVLKDPCEKFCRECASPVRENWPMQIRTGLPGRLFIAAGLLLVFLVLALFLAVTALVMEEYPDQLLSNIISVAWGVVTISGGVLLAMLLFAVRKRLKKLKSEVTDELIN